MTYVASFMLYGAELHDVALFVNRFVLGLFFFIYRFRWVYDPSDKECPWLSPRRKARLETRLASCGFSGHPVMAASVALGEIAAGMALMVGFLSVLAAVGVLVIMVFANCCTPREEIPLMNPVDKLDWASCYLRLVEPLYLLMALFVIFMGPGRFSLDHYFLGG